MTVTRGHVAGPGVQINPQRRGPPRRQTLCHQRRNDTTEHIPAAATSQPRVAVAAYADPAVGRRDQRPGALQHHDRGIPRSKLARRGKAIRLHGRRGRLQQASGFTGMRRKHGRALGERPWFVCQQIETVGIQHQRGGDAHDRLPQIASPRVLSQSRAGQDDIRRLHKRGQLVTAAHGTHHQFRPRRQHPRHVGLPRRNAGQAHAAAQRGFTRQTHGAAETVIAADHQHMTVIALVAVACARRQCDRCQHFGIRARAVAGSVRKIQRVQAQCPAGVHGMAREQAAFESHEAGGRLGVDHGTCRHAGVSADARGDIQSQYRLAAIVDGGNQCGGLPFQGAGQTAAEQSVHDDIAVRAGRIRARTDFDAGVDALLAGIGSISGGGVSQGAYVHIQARLVRQHCQHKAVAPIVARPARDADGRGVRPTPAQNVNSCRGGALHQSGTGYALSLDGMCIQSADSGVGIQARAGHRCHDLASITATASTMTRMSAAGINYADLAHRIKTWATDLGFDAAGITDIDLEADAAHLQRWLQAGRHGEMAYMANHADKRARPDELHPGTKRVISVRLNYVPPEAENAEAVLDDPERGYVSRYALGRDYHKLMRKRLQKLAQRIEAEVGAFGYRAFVDSAPVLEKALARDAGLGWIGKHTLLLSRDAGSWFFLGELFTDLPLPADAPEKDYCGTCTRCMEVCPTGAITGPYQLDATRCISYLTIEMNGSIPEELREPMGNRIFGCDDCQVFCPWNKFAQATADPDFAPRHSLDGPRLVELFAWDEDTFLARTEGMAIRRAGHTSWLRNVAVALGNAPRSSEVVDALQARAEHPSAIVREHVAWALRQQAEKRADAS